MNETEKQLLMCLEFFMRMQSSNPPSGFDRVSRIQGAREALAKARPELKDDAYYGPLLTRDIAV